MVQIAILRLEALASKIAGVVVEQLLHHHNPSLGSSFEVNSGKHSKASNCFAKHKTTTDNQLAIAKLAAHSLSG